jgi:hypothetical protein
VPDGSTEQITAIINANATRRSGLLCCFHHHPFVGVAGLRFFASLSASLFAASRMA